MDDQKCADAEVARHAERSQHNDHLHSLALSNLFKLADTAINGGKLDETPRKKGEHSQISEFNDLPGSVHSEDPPQAKRDIMQRRIMIHKDDPPQLSLKNGVLGTLTSVGSQTKNCEGEVCSDSQDKEERISNGDVYSRDEKDDAKRCDGVEKDAVSVDRYECKQHKLDSAPARRRKRERCQSPTVKQSEKKEDRFNTEKSSGDSSPFPKTAEQAEKSDKSDGLEPVDRAPPQKEEGKRYPLRGPMERTFKTTRQARPHDFIYETLHNLMRKVRAKVDRYGFFSGKVDPVEAECPDYYDIIDPVTEAMDLDTMEEMIDAGNLRTIDAFERYLDRIVFCAKKYNTDEDNFVRMEADKIHALVRPLIDFARQKLEDKPGKSIESKNVDAVGSVKDTVAQMDTKGMPNTARRKRRRSQEVDLDLPDMSVSSSTSDMVDVIRSSSSVAHGARTEYPSTVERKRTRADKGRSDSDPSTASEPNDRLRPSRAAKRKINYCESGPVHLTAPESCSTPKPTPRRRRAKKTTPGLEGSDIPLCEKDLSSSVISSCSSRDEWLSYCHEMILVCNEAARRAALREDPDADSYDKPLSEVYMAERMEYQKPLQGFIVRAKTAPHHLQGFIVTTNFTTWRKSFRWTMDVAAGITPTDRRLRATDDGSLTSELQGVDRLYEGEKSHRCVIFSRVAEIALLGGLGCGGHLVRRALAELRSSGDYDYVVLQSTKMAIPFYERLGFIRVGAVTRFRDNNLMPEVAYRHWSEIVDGEAIEASYMMALRLNDSFKPPSTRQRASLPASETTRKLEILDALESAFSILLIALTMRATGSPSYSNTYLELLTTANDFAVSAQDKHLMNVLDDARKEFTGSKIGQSKAVLREKLDLPKTKDIHRQNSTSSAYESEDTDSQPVTKSIEPPDDLSQEKKSVAVSVQLGGKTYQPTDHEHASVSALIPISDMPFLLSSKALKRGSDWVHGSLAVSVSLGGSAFLPEQPSEGRRLRSQRNSGEDRDHPTLEATSYFPSRENMKDLRDSVSTALENLNSFPHDPSRASDHSTESVLDLPLKLGDSIMLKVPGYDGSPLWLPVDIERQCRRHELPKEEKAHWGNCFVVKIVEPYGITRASRMLDSSNRGVGREWATMTDWHSFSVLPPRILDKILIGSWVNYPAEDGEVREGTITRRVGGGLDAEPKWRLSMRSTGSEDSEDNGIYEDLKAGALREAVEVSEENMHHALSLLKTMGPPFLSEDNLDSSVKLDIDSSSSDVDEESKAKEGSDTEATRGEAAAGWAAARFEKYKLGIGAGVQRQGRSGPVSKLKGKRPKSAEEPATKGPKTRRRG